MYRFIWRGEFKSAFAFSGALLVMEKRADGTRLQGECLKLGIEMHKKHFENIHEAFEQYPGAKAYFNCTGLGSYHLKGVEDHSLFPARVSRQFQPS